MVAESAQVPFLCGIYELSPTERHEVEVFDALIMILRHSLVKCSFTNDFSNVFENELISPQARIRAKSKALLFRLNDRDIGKKLALESLVLTCLTASAVARALHFDSAVGTIRILAAGMVDMFDRIWENG